LTEAEKEERRRTGPSISLRAGKRRPYGMAKKERDMKESTFLFVFLLRLFGLHRIFIGKA